MSSGDVDEGMRVLAASRMDAFLADLFCAGKPFFGFSAGSIMLARSWVRWADAGDDSTAEMFPCLGFAPVLCDTHGEREGWEELRTLAKLAPAGSVGYGIPSGTALVVAADGTVSALGGEIHRFRRTRRGVLQLESLLPG